MKHKALNQLVCAALVNHQFRDTLLCDPNKAINAGYLGQRFPLTYEERNLVLNIKAQALEDFATQVYSWLNAGERVSPAL